MRVTAQEFSAFIFAHSESYETTDAYIKACPTKDLIEYIRDKTLHERICTIIGNELQARRRSADLPDVSPQCSEKTADPIETSNLLDEQEQKQESVKRAIDQATQAGDETTQAREALVKQKSANAHNAEALKQREKNLQISVGNVQKEVRETTHEVQGAQKAGKQVVQVINDVSLMTKAISKTVAIFEMSKNFLIANAKRIVYVACYGTVGAGAAAIETQNPVATIGGFVAGLASGMFSLYAFEKTRRYCQRKPTSSLETIELMT